MCVCMGGWEWWGGKMFSGCEGVRSENGGGLLEGVKMRFKETDCGSC